MDMRQIEYVVAIAEFGSFSAAAAELYISQSSLSKQIMALEEELGVRLIDRSKRKITLTAAGVTFVQHARIVQAAYRTLLADLEEYRPTATLTICTIPVIAQYGIAALIARFQQMHPEIRLHLDELEAADILPAFTNGQYELAFLRDNMLEREAYLCLDIAIDQFVALVSTQHPYADRASLALAELSNEAFIMFDTGTVVRELAVDACRAAGFEPRIVYTSLRIESIISMVAANSGVALMMQRIFAYHRPADVVAIPLEEQVTSTVVLAAPRDRKRSRAARLLIEFIQNSR